jgi:hypothetical protein
MVHRCGVLVEKHPPDVRGVAQGQFADIGGIVEMPTQGPAIADALQAGPDQDVDVLGRVGELIRMLDADPRH